MSSRTQRSLGAPRKGKSSALKIERAACQPRGISWILKGKPLPARPFRVSSDIFQMAYDGAADISILFVSDFSLA
jgi:hypothetical protein